MDAYICTGGEADEGGYLVELVYATSRGKAKALAMSADGWFGWVEFTDVRAKLIAKNLDCPAGRALDNDPLWGQSGWEFPTRE